MFRRKIWSSSSTRSERPFWRGGAFKSSRPQPRAIPEKGQSKRSTEQQRHNDGKIHPPRESPAWQGRRSPFPRRGPAESCVDGRRVGTTLYRGLATSRRGRRDLFKAGIRRSRGTAAFRRNGIRLCGLRFADGRRIQDHLYAQTNSLICAGPPFARTHCPRLDSISLSIRERAFRETSSALLGRLPFS